MQIHDSYQVDAIEDDELDIVENFFDDEDDDEGNDENFSDEDGDDDEDE